MKTIAIAIVTMIGGGALGFILAGAINKVLFKRVRSLRKEIAGEKLKIGVMDKVLAFEAVILIAYTVADLFVFWHTGAEPYTLTTCVFGVCGIENGVMGWIKTNKDKQRTEPPESPVKREEPPDVGM